MHNPLHDDLDRVLRDTAPMWNQMRGGRLFITGGTGFFGSWLLESFHWANEKLSLNAEVTVLTRNPARFRSKLPHLFGRTRLAVGDVRDFEFPTGPYSHIIHAAADAAVPMTPENAGDMIDTITCGTERVLRFAQVSRNVRFLHVSSGAVYGDQPEPCEEAMLDVQRGEPMQRSFRPISEAPTNLPFAGADYATLKGAYSEAKRGAEAMVSAASVFEGLDAVIARCFSFAGPYMPLDTHFAFGNFVRDALAGKTIEVKGDGSPIRSYQYAADLATWLWTILFRGQAARPYNVGSECEVTIADLARLVSRSVEPEVDVYCKRETTTRDVNQRYVPSTARARNELNLRESYSLEDAIRLTVRHNAGHRQADSHPNGNLWHRSELETPWLAMASPATSSLK